MTSAVAASVSAGPSIGVDVYDVDHDGAEISELTSRMGDVRIADDDRHGRDGRPSTPATVPSATTGAAGPIFGPKLPSASQMATAAASGASQSSSSTTGSSTAEEWQCEMCTLNNRMTDRCCDACGTPRHMS